MPFSLSATISSARQAVNRAVFGENSPIPYPLSPIPLTELIILLRGVA